MGKLQDKRIELAKRVLDTTDAKTLDIIDQVLMAGQEQRFTKAEIEEFEAIIEGMKKGTIKSLPWEEVRSGMLKSLSK
ncbi:MAG: hypothetical protein R2818_07500 [Flavobacteriales bacterium]